MKYAISGRVVSMAGKKPLSGPSVVYVEDDTITAVCRADAPCPEGFEQTKVAATGGTIFPGLVELHNHISYNALPLWQVDRAYTNRDQWAGTPYYRAHVTGPMRVIGGMPELLPALARYVEAKSLLAGVTSTQGVAMFSNAGVRRYYRGVVRNVEQSLDAELPNADGRIADIDSADAAAFLARLEKSKCMLLHLSEGTDAAARSHFLALRTGSRWAIAKSLAGIHCVALRPEDFDVLAQHGASMVWSPTSNLLLYGKTADVAAARKAGVRVGLGADWSTSGTRNLLAELRMARAAAGDAIPARDLVAMATCDGAKILGWDKVLGTVEKGKRADLIVLDTTAADPCDALTRADEGAISLVVINGIPRSGTPGLMKALGAKGETVKVGSGTRVLSFRDVPVDPAVPFVELGEARDRLRKALKGLPQVAAKLEASVPRAFGALHRGPAVWFLALDELGETGAELRPRLGGHGPVERAPTKPLSELVVSLELDPLTVVDDAGYWEAMGGQKNLPADVKNRLTKA